MTDVVDGEDVSPVASAARRPISRRAVGLGAVWSVPVILIAVAAPAAAASLVVPDPLPPVVGATVTADKIAASGFGIKHIDFALTLTNTGTGAATVQVLSIVSDKTSGTQHSLPTTVVVPVSGTKVVNFSYEYLGNAGTATYTITYSVSGIGTLTITITA